MGMKEQPLPTTQFPQTEYSHYFSLYQNKAAFLSDIFKESVPLGHATRRLIEADLAIAIKVRKTNGKKDFLVRMK